MAFINVMSRTMLFTPAVVTTDETKALFNVHKGDRVLWASAIVQVAASVGQVGTMSLGDGTDVAGFIAAFTPTAASAGVGVPINGAGALLATSGGKLYTVDDTVDVVFDYTSGGVILPRVRFIIAIVREYAA